MARPLDSEDQSLSHQSDGVAILESLTPLERLPTELMWMLIEYTPTSIYDLRLSYLSSVLNKRMGLTREALQTSHSLCSRVDAYALSDIPFVEELTLLALTSGKLDVKIVIRRIANIIEQFKLRLKLTLTRIDIIKRTEIGRMTIYRIYLSVSDYNSLTIVGKSLGRRIRKVALYHCNDINELTAVDKLIRGMRFHKLKVVGNLSDDIVSHLLNTIRAHSVEHVTIELNHNYSTDKVGLLRELSSLVRSLHIQQGHVEGLSRRSRYFFGEYDVDWAPILLDMLSKKLDKLCIENNYYPGYLKNEYVDILRERIPKLDKCVWFDASCEALIHPLKYMSDEYSVTVFPGVIWNFGTQFSRSSLNVVHVSRDDEGDIY